MKYEQKLCLAVYTHKPRLTSPSQKQTLAQVLPTGPRVSTFSKATATAAWCSACVQEPEVGCRVCPKSEPD